MKQAIIILILASSALSLKGQLQINISSARNSDFPIIPTENNDEHNLNLGSEKDTLKIQPNKDHANPHLRSNFLDLEEVIISGSTRASLASENPIAIASVSSKQIERTAENNIIDILVKNVPGLKAVKTGPNISKPFIHGLGYNRVLTLYDGIRQEGQQYGDEHGLEIDDYNIERAEVIKGPASLLYGSDAIAGVISLFPYIPSTHNKKLNWKYLNEYQTNNNLIGNSLRLYYSTERFLFVLNGSYRMAKNYRNPIDGRVYLTNFNVTNLSAIAGYKTDKGFTYFNLTLYDNHQGIPDGSRDSLTRKFTKQTLEQDQDDILNRPIVPEQELNSYKIPDLSQHIQHYRAYLHSSHEIGSGDVDVLFGVQQNIRREFTHPTNAKQAGMYMRLNTLNYGIRYNAPRFANIETAIGINGMLQSNKNKDATDFPIPDYNLIDGGIYLYGKWKKDKWSISGGARYDLRQVQWNDFYVAEDPYTGFEKQSDANNPSADLQFEAFKKTYRGISGSIGATFHANKNISLKANVGRAYRTPNITEIGSNGLDPGAHITYLGNRTFSPEFSLQEDFGVNWKFQDVSGEIAVFNNNIQNFIFMSAIADAQGNPLLDAQGNRTYQYLQSKAQLYGGEFWFAIHPRNGKGFRLDNSLSTVYGYNHQSELKGKGTEGEYLPLIPPLMINSSLLKRIESKSKWLSSITPKFEVEHSASQNKYLGINGTETATPSYTLFNLGFTAEINSAEDRNIHFVFQVNNLFDKAYQSHLNRLKYFEYYEQSPNGKYGIYNMGRNLALKIILSF
ncbi:TonB-dependent receptor [Chryseobacterium koreense]|uniref:TonB-dependent receptor n=1 Tax=Chryseobacterium koreense TaxID=232216 RepID=UPI0026EBE02A|nr:TonB-dependent receptor [Chryseobacterium koreense]